MMRHSARTLLLMMGLAPAVAVMAAAACGENSNTGALRLQQDVADTAQGAHDPCTLLSGPEAERFVGALASPPYRASDGVPDVRGDQCMYRGRDGRQVAVQPDWAGGAMMGRTLRDVPNTMGNAVSKAGATGLDTMTHRVMQQGPAGPWDQATWIPGGALFATRGELQVQVDVSGASGQEADAVALATLIMPRFARPLAYDGAKAVALAPKPRPHPARACDLIPRAEVEAAIGRLAGAPSSDDPETSCTWRVATPQGERAYPVSFAWEGGQKAFTMQKHQMATVGGVMGTPTSSPLDTLKPPPQMQAMLGGLMKAMGGGSAAGGTSAAPGAAATIGFRTDTALAGPWDHGALLHGTELLAVKGDVMVAMSLQSADYDRARKLLAAICNRL